MSKTQLYTPEKIDFTKEPMFFGKGKNIQRFDAMKYEFFDKKNDKMQGLDWVHDEIDMQSDGVDFKTKMSEHYQFIYTRDLQKLIFLDSLQGRGPMLTLGQITTLPELENAILTWTYFEGAKHSKTYTHNLRNVYANPSEIFDGSFDIPELQKLAKSISEPFNDMYKLAIKYIYNDLWGFENTPEFMVTLRKSTLKLIVAINILEGVRFYTGFASIWAMTEGQDLVNGTSKNLKLICRDENQHLALTQKMLQLLKKDKSNEFTEIYEDFRVELVEMYKIAHEEESDWIDYKFSKGSIIGLNSDILKLYLKFLINKRLKAIGEKPLFPEVTSDPLPWVDSYINSDGVEELPQEGEITNYISGGIDKTSNKDLEKQLTDFKL